MNNWSCLPKAFARALNISFDEFVKLVGHDGSEIIWPDQPEPRCRRGFTIQECIIATLELGYAVTPIAISCNHASSLTDDFPLRIDYSLAFTYTILKSVGVITGETKKGQGHAVAYRYGHIFDIVEYIYSFENCEVRNFIPKVVWRIDGI